jgi:protein SCO1/2
MNASTEKADPNRQLLLTGGALAVVGLWYQRRAAAHGADHPHHEAQAASELKRSQAYYPIPAATLVRQDGAQVPFAQELDDGKPVILDFIYTSCTSICPVSSMVFSQLQGMVGPEAKMLSISIDPEFDTPPRLLEYAQKFGATARWQHYTGAREAILAVQKAFNVYRGDKTNHFAATFLRAAPAQPWLRLEGFATPEDLAREYRRLGTAS